MNSSSSTTKKMLIVGLLMLICWIPSAFVHILVYERENRQEDVVREITQKWGEQQTVGGPVLIVPYEDRIRRDDNGVDITEGDLYLLPESLQYTVDIEPEIRARGIYETAVYQADMLIQGNFGTPNLAQSSPAYRTFQWDKAYVSVGMTDTRGIEEGITIQWNENVVPFEPGSRDTVISYSGVHAAVPMSVQDAPVFTFKIPLRGHHSVNLLPLGKETKAAVNSTWDAPSFTGEFLPSSYNIVEEEGFNANWSVSSFGRSYPQQWLSTEQGYSSYQFAESAFGVELYQGMDFYTKISRTVKYAILFIILTFLTFFLFEVLNTLAIHPFQYLLVGAALGLFYLLLLSFAEHIGFLWAYLLSTITIVGVLTGYCYSVLGTWRRSCIIAALLVALYTYLYILMRMEDYALLFGSLLLLVVLSVVMYVTRNVNWYGEKL